MSGSAALRGSRFLSNFRNLKFLHERIGVEGPSRGSVLESFSGQFLRTI